MYVYTDFTFKIFSSPNEQHIVSNDRRTYLIIWCVYTTLVRFISLILTNSKGVESSGYRYKQYINM